LLVLLPERVVRPRVDPEVRMQAMQDVRVRPQAVERRVPLEARERAPEDRGVARGAFVAGPALDDRELARMLHRRGDRAVAPFGEAADRAAAPRWNRAVARVDGVHDVA